MADKSKLKEMSNIFSIALKEFRSNDTKLDEETMVELISTIIGYHDANKHHEYSPYIKKYPYEVFDILVMANDVRNDEKIIELVNTVKTDIEHFGGIKCRRYSDGNVYHIEDDSADDMIISAFSKIGLNCDYIKDDPAGCPGLWTIFVEEFENNVYCHRYFSLDEDDRMFSDLDPFESTIAKYMKNVVVNPSIEKLIEDLRAAHSAEMETAHNRGYAYGYDDGFDKGHDTGYDVGYDRGLDDGFERANEN